MKSKCTVITRSKNSISSTVRMKMAFPKLLKMSLHGSKKRHYDTWLLKNFYSIFQQEENLLNNSNENAMSNRQKICQLSKWPSFKTNSSPKLTNPMATTLILKHTITPLCTKDNKTLAKAKNNSKDSKALPNLSSNHSKIIQKLLMISRIDNSSWPFLKHSHSNNAKNNAKLIELHNHLQNLNKNISKPLLSPPVWHRWAFTNAWCSNNAEKNNRRRSAAWSWH